MSTRFQYFVHAILIYTVPEAILHSHSKNLVQMSYLNHFRSCQSTIVPPFTYQDASFLHSGIWRLLQRNYSTAHTVWILTNTSKSFHSQYYIIPIHDLIFKSLPVTVALHLSLSMTGFANSLVISRTSAYHVIVVIKVLNRFLDIDQILITIN